MANKSSKLATKSADFTVKNAKFGDKKCIQIWAVGTKLASLPLFRVVGKSSRGIHYTNPSSLLDFSLSCKSAQGLA